MIVAVVSQRLAAAAPDDVLKELVLDLCRVVLGRAGTDEILHDDVDLTTDSGRLSWKAGVSLFAAQGDLRWWHDHRFPGGVALSLNSIGHVAAVRSMKMPRGLDFDARRLRNLHQWALRLAMRTIRDASMGPRRCTWLVPEEPRHDGGQVVEQGKRLLEAMSKRRYRGVYHTDFTVPSAFFKPGLPSEEFDLSLSYLHDPEDPEYHTIALGHAVDPPDATSPAYPR
jgi:hypothetical protein